MAVPLHVCRFFIFYCVFYSVLSSLCHLVFPAKHAIMIVLRSMPLCRGCCRKYNSKEHVMVNLNIGQKIQRYRNQRGLSLRGLAEKTGITASMISQIENNSVNPSINTLKTLAETLDFPLYVLFQEENDPEPKQRGRLQPAYSGHPGQHRICADGDPAPDLYGGQRTHPHGGRDFLCRTWRCGHLAQR